MRSMLRFTVATLLAALPLAATAQTLFFEDFQTAPDPATGDPVPRCQGAGGAGTYPFPEGWMLRNVDNRTPDAQVAYVNEAWEVREDFGDNVLNCVAFSTSYYAPVGAADDWMWTPLIGPLPDGARLTWRARAYDAAYRDGYEVRVMLGSLGPPTGGTGVIGNQLTQSTVLFSTPAEESTWTTRSVDLASFAGQSVYIGFRNTANDKFLLVVDDVRVEQVVEFDPELLSIQAPAGLEYSEVPAWLGLALDPEATVRNAGTAALTGVAVEAEVLVDGLPVDTLGSAPLALDAGAQATVPLGQVVYSAPGHWALAAMVGSDQGDELPANSVLAIELAEVTGETLRRAQGDAVGNIGIGAGNGGEIGTDFALPGQAVLRAVRLSLDNNDIHPLAADPADAGDGIPDFNGYTLEVVVRAWDTVADAPGAVVASATSTVPGDAAAGPLALEFPFDGLLLPPGRFLVALREPTEPEPRTLTLHTHLQRFTPGTTWVTWPTAPGGGWSNMEDFGQSFERAQAITAVLREAVLAPVAVDDAFVVAPGAVLSASVAGNDTPSDQGGNAWTVVAPPASGSLVLEPSGAFTYTPDPAAAGSAVSFGYSVCDADLDCDEAVAGITILPYAIFGDSFE